MKYFVFHLNHERPTKHYGCYKSRYKQHTYTCSGQYMYLHPQQTQRELLYNTYKKWYVVVFFITLRRQISHQHRDALLTQLKDCADEALCLHLAVMIVFQNCTHCLVHAPGGCVPSLISFLQKRIPADDHFKLLTLQQIVQRKLTSSEDEEPVSDDTLRDSLAEVKAVATAKKGERAAAQEAAAAGTS